MKNKLTPRLHYVVIGANGLKQPTPKVSTSDPLRMVSFEHDQHTNYKPDIAKLLFDQDSEFVVELRRTHAEISFRILRIKNNRRTHDFIINSFSGNKIVIENDKSQYVVANISSIKLLMDLFSKCKLYRHYTRSARWNYTATPISKITVNNLFKEAGLI